MSKSTTADRVAHDELHEALWALEQWAHRAARGEETTSEEGARLAAVLVARARRHKEKAT